MDLQCRVAERRSNLRGCLLEPVRPLGVVLDEHDLPIGRRRFADRDGENLLVVHPLEDGSFAEQRLRLGEEVRDRLDLVLRPEHELLRSLGHLQ